MTARLKLLVITGFIAYVAVVLLTRKHKPSTLWVSSLGEMVEDKLAIGDRQVRGQQQGLNGSGEPVHHKPTCEEVLSNRSHRLYTTKRSKFPKSRTLVEIFPRWTTQDPHDKVSTRRVYLYSAFIAIHHTRPNGTDVHIVVRQEGRQQLKLRCCLLYPEPCVIQESACEIDYRMHAPNHIDHAFGMVYRCHFPASRQQVESSHVTVAPTSCPVDIRQYLPVQTPEMRPGGLALCGKIAYGLQLDPRKLVEWFEIQRLLGVDKIQIFDLNNTDEVRTVFRHYQDSGLLTLLPWKLPGRPWGRVMKPPFFFVDDETPPLWDCRLRLAGYDHVIGIDMDEVIVIRKYTSLKPYLQDTFNRRKQLSALNFKVQFFVYNWGPVDPKAPLTMLQYLNSTVPTTNRHKYIYMPSRVQQVMIHDAFSYKGYRKKWVPPSEGVVCHYRWCPDDVDCTSQRVLNPVMHTFANAFIPRVMTAFKQIGLQPNVNG